MIPEEQLQLLQRLVCLQQVLQPPLLLFFLLVSPFPASIPPLSFKLLFLDLQWLEDFLLSLEVFQVNIRTCLDNNFHENIPCILGS